MKNELKDILNRFEELKYEFSKSSFNEEKFVKLLLEYLELKYGVLKLINLNDFVDRFSKILQFVKNDGVYTKLLNILLKGNDIK